MNVTLVIPARDEAETIGGVIREVREYFAGPIVVVDNGSADATASIAAEEGALVTAEVRPGYGCAVEAGIAAAPAEAEVFVFMDADGSDRPQDIARLLAAIEAGATLAIGVRVGEAVEPGSIAPPARFGNWFSGRLIGALWGRTLHDLSPLKAIRADALRSLDLREQTYGWTVEMLAKAVRAGLVIAEVDAGYRHRRGGTSKVSGNLGASAMAGYRILSVLVRLGLSGMSRATRGALIGAGLGLAALASIAAWLIDQAPSSSGVLVAPALLAWPVVLVTMGAGAGVANLLGHVHARKAPPPFIVGSDS